MLIKAVAILSALFMIADAATIHVCTSEKYAGNCSDFDVAPGECSTSFVDTI